MRGWITGALLPVLTLFASATTQGKGEVVHDAAHRLVTMTDGRGSLVMRLNYDGRCVLDRVTVLGREVARADTGVCSAVKVGETWFTTRGPGVEARVSVEGETVEVSGIVFGPESAPISERWRFEVGDDGVRWRIERAYASPGTYSDTYFPGWDFRDIGTWTGGLLDTGGVVWTKYLDTPVATYGAHSGAVTFWNKEHGDCLNIVPTLDAGMHIASRFSHHPSSVFSASFSVTDSELSTRTTLARFLPDRQDLWGDFAIKPGTVAVEYSIRALKYDAAYDRGTFKGVDGTVIRELLNTIGRYGVIDRGITGSNGWRSSYAVTHEPWFALAGIAIDDEAYTANYAASLDDIAKHAVTPEGRVLSRWHHNAEDAVPGSYDPATGYYECQWGYMMDSQPSYVINVAEEFDLTGDLAWLRGHQKTCRAALDFMLRRDRDGNGLLEMMNDSWREGKSSDWIDIVWASYENALVNAEMYQALVLWAGVEEVLGDAAQGAHYRDAAARLKAAFNRPVSAGGFWSPTKNCYAYWREADGSVHGKNLVIPVNFAALAYDVCDDEMRRRSILDQIESLMQKEGLFHWPLCFFPFGADEVHASQKEFPTYENGDLFLGWGELGVRAYARTEPAVALKYIRKVMEQYQRDGLSFQRYLRVSQKGAGDDILANNCMAVAGLYRDIYGVRPRHDRLWLEPRITPDLAGTRLKYTLRGRRYEIALEQGSTTAASAGASVTWDKPFGVDLSPAALDFFSEDVHGAVLSVERAPGEPLEVRIGSWPNDPARGRAWMERCGGTGAQMQHTVAGLRPGGTYALRRDGSTPQPLTADGAGRVQFRIDASGERLIPCYLVPE